MRKDGVCYGGRPHGGERERLRRSRPKLSFSVTEGIRQGGCGVGIGERPKEEDNVGTMGVVRGSKPACDQGAVKEM